MERKICEVGLPPVSREDPGDMHVPDDLPVKRGVLRRIPAFRSAFHPESRRSARREVPGFPSGKSPLKECNFNGDFSPSLNPSRLGLSA